MALAALKTFIAGEVLTASDLNALNTNILNNALSLVSPVTGAFDFDGQTITLDAAAATQVVSSAAVSWNFTSGAKTGTPATTGSVERFSAQTFTDNATAGSGTATAHVFYSIAVPTLAATNALVTTTDAATWYIAGVPAAGTNETITNSWAFWVDAGNVRFDDDIIWLSGQTFAQRGILAHANTGIRTYTFPDASITVVGDSSTVTLTNKTISLASNTLTGTTAEFNTALSDGDFATIAGTETLTNKTLTSPTLTTPAIGAATGTSVVLTGDASAATVSGAQVATQAQQETGTATNLIVTPGRQHFHPGSFKAWVKFNAAGTIAASYNVTSITDTGTGNWTVVIATDFSSANYYVSCNVGRLASGNPLFLSPNVIAAGSCQVVAQDTANAVQDPTEADIIFAGFAGDQA